MIEDAAGRVTAQSEVPTTPAGLAHLRAAHRLPPDTPVALETATVAFFVARQLAASGLSPQVIDAHEVRLKAHRPTQKSDRRDAFELCEGLRRGSYRAIVHVPRAEVLRLLSRRRHFVRLQSAQISTVKALLRGAGLGGLSRSLGSERGWAQSTPVSAIAARRRRPRGARVAGSVPAPIARFQPARRFIRPARKRLVARTMAPIPRGARHPIAIDPTDTTWRGGQVATCVKGLAEASVRGARGRVGAATSAAFSAVEAPEGCRARRGPWVDWPLFWNG